MAQTIQPIRFTNGKLFLLNQIVLPTEFVYEEIKTCEEAFDAIRNMKVRGAPALAIAAVLSVAAEASQALLKDSKKTKQEIVEWVAQKVNYLITARFYFVHLAFILVTVICFCSSFLVSFFLSFFLFAYLYMEE